MAWPVAVPHILSLWVYRFWFVRLSNNEFLLPITVKLGRHSRVLGVVCTSFVLFVGLGLGISAWKVGGFWSVFNHVSGSFFLQAPQVPVCMSSWSIDFHDTADHVTQIVHIDYY